MIAVRVYRIPIATALALMARAHGFDPARALDWGPNEWAAAIAAAKKRRVS